MAGVSHCNELRLVLLGGYRSGKSEMVHSFLNIKCQSDQMTTTQCVKMEGNIHGRKIILVDAPGWWKGDQLCDSPHRLKVELIKSTTFCPPGPHVFLLMIEADTAFTDKHRKAAEGHMELIGDGIWNHTIVVFTKLRYLTAQQYVENEGENLNKLTQKCGNRYVGFDSDLDTEGSQKELFSQIEKLVAENNECYFYVDAAKLTGMEIKLKKVEERATARERKVFEKRRKLEEIKNADAKQTSSSTPLNIVLLGWILSGKTLAGSVILNAEISFEKTVKCVRTCGEVNGRQVTVVDTPSWWKFLPHQLNADSIKNEILKAMDFSPNAVLLVIPADTSFLEEQLEVILDNMRQLGENIWSKTIVLFTWGGTLGDKSIEYHIESEGEALVRLVEMCGNRYHVFESLKDDHTQVNQLLEKIDEMMLEDTLLNSKEEHWGDKKNPQETEMLSEWLWAEDVKILINEEWERSDTMMKEMMKTMCPVVKRDKSIDTPLEFSREGIRAGLFVNKHQLKTALEREWNHQEAVDVFRIQHRKEMLDVCADMEDST